MDNIHRLVACLGCFLCFASAQALEPRDVFLLVNKNVPASAVVAAHYCERRGVPADHVLTLDLPRGEDISRDEFQGKLRGVLREQLWSRREECKVLITTYGVPLRVGPADDGGVEKKQLPESVASVDSELSLLWWDDYELARWQPNLLNFQVSMEIRRNKPAVLMVARLDGPSSTIAMGLVDLALAAEATGLEGKVYVDARGIAYEPAKDAGYAYGGYDESLREMARLLQDEAKLPVVLDDRPELFASGSCPEAALYCGWYSLAKYVDCCSFVPGAVAYHIASSEAVTLRTPSSQQWCKRLLESGVAATIGPVAEPYTVGFPKPAEFFGFLATGKFTLVECYYRTAHFNSWMMVLVGDPLYNPFAKRPRLKVEQVKPSPVGGRFLFHRTR